MLVCDFFVFSRQKTAYELRISDWSSDVCSSDLVEPRAAGIVEDRGDDGFDSAAVAPGEPAIEDQGRLAAVDERDRRFAGRRSQACQNLRQHRAVAGSRNQHADRKSTRLNSSH